VRASVCVRRRGRGEVGQCARRWCGAVRHTYTQGSAHPHSAPRPALRPTRRCVCRPGHTAGAGGGVVAWAHGSRIHAHRARMRLLGRVSKRVCVAMCAQAPPVSCMWPCMHACGHAPRSCCRPAPHLNDQGCRGVRPPRLQLAPGVGHLVVLEQELGTRGARVSQLSEEPRATPAHAYARMECWPRHAAIRGCSPIVRPAFAQRERPPRLL
jgi:hypothetical protein